MVRRDASRTQAKASGRISSRTVLLGLVERVLLLLDRLAQALRSAALLAIRARAARRAGAPARRARRSVRLADPGAKGVGLGPQLVVAQRLNGLLVLVDLLDQRPQPLELRSLLLPKTFFGSAAMAPDDEADADADAAEQQRPRPGLGPPRTIPIDAADDGADDRTPAEGSRGGCVCSCSGPPGPPLNAPGRADLDRHRNRTQRAASGARSPARACQRSICTASTGAPRKRAPTFMNRSGASVTK